ncbi:MAG: leucine-rich repeat domain-containing protein [Promethearchaeota archaeon]
MKNITLNAIIINDLERVIKELNQGQESRIILFQDLINWMSGEDGKNISLELDSTTVLPGDRELIVNGILKEELFNEIESRVKKFNLRLHPDNWVIFQGVASWHVNERIMKKFLPLTDLDDFSSIKVIQEIKASNHVIRYMKLLLDEKHHLLVDFLARFVEKSINHAFLASRIVNLLIFIVKNDEFLEKYALVRLASIIARCRNKVQRRIFTDLFAMHGDKKIIIDSMLRSGSRSIDLGLDIIDYLDKLDPEVVEDFLINDARVIHRNYFLRLYSVKQLLPRGKVDKNYLVEFLRIFGIRAIDQQVKFRHDVRKKALQYLLKSNPFALNRQFISWQKRISNSLLDPGRVTTIKKAIGMYLEKFRRNIIFSPEFSIRNYLTSPTRPEALKAGITKESFMSLRWKSNRYIRSLGLSIRVLAVNEVMSMPDFPGDLKVIGAGVGDLFTAIQKETGTIAIIDASKTDGIPSVLPLEFKNAPWVIFSGNKVIGLGLSGMRLKKIPAFVYQVNSSLKILDLSNNYIRKVTKLSEFPELRYLDLSRNNIFKMSNLNAFSSKIRVLDLHCNHLKTLDVMPFSTSLKVLDVSRNSIRRIETLKNLQACKELSILNASWNQIKSLSSLSPLPKLKHLYLRGNKIVKLGEVPRVPSLSLLDLSDNYLGGLKNITSFPNLFYLDVKQNYLKKVDDVLGLRKLKYFNAGNNQINALPDDFIMKLDIFNFKNNPLEYIEIDVKERYGLPF